MVRQRTHRSESLGGPSIGSTRDKTKTACTHAIDRFFRSGNLGYTNNRSPLSSTHRFIRLQFARRMGAQTDTLQWRHIYCSLYIYYGESDHSSNFGTRQRSSYERACQDCTDTSTRHWRHIFMQSYVYIMRTSMATCSDYVVFNAVISTSGHQWSLAPTIYF